jgi:thiosulfate dehydrogenase
VLTVLLATACVAAPAVIHAFSQGAGRGFSGGPESGGQNCTTCHEFNIGTGSVELAGIERRYRVGTVYDLTIRVSDPEQVGAGFEISAETAGGHTGTFILSDPVFTREADDGGPEYITQTLEGYLDSLDHFVPDGGFYDYHLQWQAPDTDAGPVTFFVAAQALNNADAFRGDHFYFTHRTATTAVSGDADGDTDRDLLDLASFQQCIGAGESFDLAQPCITVDWDGDGLVTLADADDLLLAMTGPTATGPGGYVLGDPVRGGLLYDKWWAVNGAPEPVGTHPLYPEFGEQAGSTTFRCKECHGWDYKGRDGAYGSGSHFTDIAGIDGTILTPQELFDLLTADPNVTPNGHNMGAFGMDDQDVWDVVQMTLEGVVDADAHIDETGAFTGSELIGQNTYPSACGSCHGFDGTFINLGTDSEPEYVGGLARGNPWEFLHKVRFGHPGSPMPSLELLGKDASDASDIGTYAVTLP